ncbi:hypothetical protein AAG570_004681 [Ranatra chinensis]|uniref:Uncharacterized protein n=1 Tax=Ranatra chinensis TaxID=642074 RepID=A0ABD0Y3T6_9HEMI
MSYDTNSTAEDGDSAEKETDHVAQCWILSLHSWFKEEASLLFFRWPLGLGGGLCRSRLRAPACGPTSLALGAFFFAAVLYLPMPGVDQKREKVWLDELPLSVSISDDPSSTVAISRNRELKARDVRPRQGTRAGLDGGRSGACRWVPSKRSRGTHAAAQRAFVEVVRLHRGPCLQHPGLNSAEGGIGGWESLPSPNDPGIDGRAVVPTSADDSTPRKRDRGCSIPPGRPGRRCTGTRGS